ncbi:MAG: type IV secretory system conjugative DNA transfer family protein, partial [Neglectibacter timonensis]
MRLEVKKRIIANLPYLLFVYLFGKLGQTYRLAAGADLSEKFLHLADGFSFAFESVSPSFRLFDLAVGVAGAVALRLMVYVKSKNAKKYRKGVEYGSARWGGPRDIAPYIDPVFDNNILLT